MFDLGSTYSRMSTYCAPLLELYRNSLYMLLYISTLVSDFLELHYVLRSCVVIVKDVNIHDDLTILDMVYIYVILDLN